jgi:hypothetical protein
MHSERHTIGDADLFNDQAGKIGKYHHRLLLNQEMVSGEICSTLEYTTYVIIGLDTVGEPARKSPERKNSLLRKR